MFHVGQKIVCIHDINPRHIKFGESVPVKGAVYTIRGIDACCGDGSLGFWLEEIVNQPRRYADGFRECCFGQEGFRPIMERKTDISVFTEMLMPTPKRVHQTTEC